MLSFWMINEQDIWNENAFQKHGTHFICGEKNLGVNKNKIILKFASLICQPQICQGNP